jgi:hypothetical protein
MKNDDFSRARPAALPACIVIPRAVKSCGEPSEDMPSGRAPIEEYVPMPNPQAPWPRVFPGL